MLLADRVKEARKLREEGHYRNVIDECGKILQEIFEDLYKEYLPRLSDPEVEKVLNYRKQVGKSTDKFMIGEWIGLFQVADLFNTIERNLRKPDEKDFVFFTLGTANQLKEIRNRNTHSEKDLICYNEQYLALYLESALLCMLQELRMISEGDLLSRRLSRKQNVSNKKPLSRVSREDIIRAAKDKAINDFKFLNKYVEIEGIKYPARGLLSIASGASPADFNQELVAKTFCDLGFKVMDFQPMIGTDSIIISDSPKPTQLHFSSLEEALLHLTVTKLFQKLEDLVAETKKQYPKIDGIATLSPEDVRKIIKTAWKENNKSIAPFKNDAFKHYLEELLNLSLEQETIEDDSSRI